MKRYGWIIAVALGLVAAPASVLAQGSGLDLSVSGDSVRAAYDTELTLSGLNFTLSGMHNTDYGNVFGIGLGLRANANPGRSPVTVWIGFKGLWLDPDYRRVDSGTALALGGSIKYVLPQFNRLSFGGRVFWAPSVVSFGNTDHYLGAAVRAGYRVLPNATVYVGYRRVAAAYEHTDELIMDEGLNVGFALRF